MSITFLIVGFQFFFCAEISAEQLWKKQKCQKVKEVVQELQNADEGHANEETQIAPHVGYQRSPLEGGESSRITMNIFRCK